MNELLQMVRVAPKQPAQAAVIWLHGLGADGYDFVDVIPSLQLPKDHRIEFIFPHAPAQPITLNGGMMMPAWYDIVEINADAPQDEKGIKRSEQSIQQLIDHVVESGVPADKIIVMGFSQGGALALYSGLRYPQKLAGIGALSCYLPHSQKLAAERQGANEATSIFMAHGLMDPVVPYWMGEGACAVLKNMGYPVEWHAYSIPHTVNLPEIQDIGRWIQSVL